MRKTKIISTVGPITANEEAITELAKAGTSIVRLNLSHGDHRWHEEVIWLVKKVNKKLDLQLAIMLDTTGPEIRTDSGGEEVGLEEGDTFKIAISSACDVAETEKHTHIHCEELVTNLKKKDIILVDDGLIALEVKNIENHQIVCKVLNKGKLGDKKCVNLPGIKVNLPALTDKDKKDMQLAINHSLQFVAQSFVRSKDDVIELRKVLSKAKKNINIIAKIEDEEGIRNIDEIIAEADGIMVARGDLGVELPLEEIPIVQRSIVLKCRRAGKPVVVATHMLESMVNNPRPTRAEVTDVANAVFERADAVLLTSETTKGPYYAESVKTIDKIAINVQKRFKSKIKHEYTGEKQSIKEVITKGACINAENLKAEAIVVFTKSGKLLSNIVKHRPNTNIYAFTNDKDLCRKLILNWGTVPFYMDFKSLYEKTVKDSISILKKHKLLRSKDVVVIVSDFPHKNNVDVMEIRKVE